jgi:xanthine dehydrogenase YagS FAD-binding subunit
VRPFRYERPPDAAGAVALAGRPGARFLGGGTNLVDLMRLGVEEPELLIDVARLPHDHVRELPGGGLRIGAAVCNSELGANRLVRERYPTLAQALLSGASGQLRNLATIGGNLLQRTRCLYFQDITKPCNKRHPGSGCPARDGEHYNLAVLGHSRHCVATHPSDMAVAMAALDAVADIAGPGGSRQVPVCELHRLPGEQPERDTVLEPGELITAVELPPLPAARRSLYRKVRERASFSFALISVAAVLELSDGLVSEIRIALGGVAHKPWRAERAEQALLGGAADELAFREAARTELARAQPLRDNAYKVPLVENVLVETLLELAAAQ